MTKGVLDYSELGPDFRLITPESKEFDVYGDKETIGRARQWALDQQVLLYRGGPHCVHGLYLMGQCAAPDACGKVGFDHTQIWVQADGKGAFLLTQPYVDQVPEEMLNYAWAHGLDVGGYAVDAWYQGGTLPIRLSIPQRWPMWPIERESIVLLRAMPVDFSGMSLTP